MRVVTLVTVMPALVVFASATVVLADGRVALVVGNSTYAHIRRLSNPQNDTTDVAAALRRLGFEVMTELETDRAPLTTALLAFTRRSAGGGRVAGVLRGPRHRDGRRELSRTPGRAARARRRRVP